MRSLDIKEVRDLKALHAWERVAIEGYPLDALAGAPTRSVTNESWLEEPRWRLWVGWVGESPGQCIVDLDRARHQRCHPWSQLFPDARGRGYGEALTWHAARADPSLPSMLISSDVGRPIYERMGFLPLQRITLWYRTWSS